MIATATGMILDPTQRSSQAQQLESALRARIVGQEEAIRAIVSVYQVFLAGLDLPNHPVGSLLFLGPTGSGKTRTVEATAEALFGDARALIQVDCGEFQHSHEIAKLIGSPPGYLGHRETHPVLTQEALNQWHREDHHRGEIRLQAQVEGILNCDRLRGHPPRRRHRAAR